MKKLYTILALFTLFIGSAQIVNIPDANFKAALLQASYNNEIASIQMPTIYFTFLVSYPNPQTYNKIDTNNDGEIQVIEAQAIKYLDLFNKSISDLTGIEAFTNLVTLKCYQNQLTSLNLSGLTNLQFLDCQLNQLTGIEISDAISLKVMICKNNQLTNLNVSGLTNLENFNCQNNQLSNLIVSGLTNLKSLECNNNQLTSFDASGLTNLQVIYCNQNQLTNLNVSDLPNLQLLDCGQNQLTSIDVSTLTVLQKLFCSNNLLTALDINSNSFLFQLGCSNNNQLTQLFIKNNYRQNWGFLSFDGNPNLQYICADEADLSLVQQRIDSYGYTNCYVNSYCSFTPNGTFYTIKGNSKFDMDNNGCDTNDLDIPNLKIGIAISSNTGNIIANATGSYSIPVNAGSHILTP